MPMGPGQATKSGGAMMPVTEAMTAAAVTPAGNGTEAPGEAKAETRHPGRALSAATNSLRARADLLKSIPREVFFLFSLCEMYIKVPYIMYM